MCSFNGHRWCSHECTNQQQAQGLRSVLALSFMLDFVNCTLWEVVTRCRGVFSSAALSKRGVKRRFRLTV